MAVTDTRNPASGAAASQAWQLADQAQQRAVAAQNTPLARGLSWLAGSLACDADKLAPQPADWRPVHEVRVGDLVVTGGGGAAGRGRVAPVAKVWYEGPASRRRWFVAVWRDENREPVSLYPKGRSGAAHELVVRRGA